MDNGKVKITVEKDMLADGRELFTHVAQAVRIR